MQPETTTLTGLTQAEVQAARQAHGPNTLPGPAGGKWLLILKEVVTEPMFVLLVIACSIYFLLREYPEGLLMLAAILLVSSISVYQMLRSEQVLATLKDLTQPTARVLRDGQWQEVPRADLVTGDLVEMTEGERVPADAQVLQSHDLTVNEATLTGEFYPVTKTATADSQLYMGTMVASGSARARITAVGEATRLGQLGRHLREVQPEKTPLQQQIGVFVKWMAFFGFAAFLLVWYLSYRQTHQLLQGLLAGLTLAMSVLPEEIPVALSSFMALGARRLMRERVLTRQPQTVESLGSATVICADKTGTLTEETMTVAALYDAAAAQVVPLAECSGSSCQRVLAYAMWASEPVPFDAMEKAIHEAYAATATPDLRSRCQMVHEYPLGGTPPMMTHVYASLAGELLVACKGAAEAVLSACRLAGEPRRRVLAQVAAAAAKGYRVLGVASASFTGTQYPAAQQDFDWQFEGLVYLFNPPKANIAEVIRNFYLAGIKVKVITGDYPETAKAVCRQVGLTGADHYLTGREVMQMSPTELRQHAASTSVFARMYPEAKLKVIGALKETGEVVAMTGDGVNDGPALKAAHIGVAMGRRGTEVARRAASLILLDDDLSKMVEALIIGRKIYANLKKAVRYIISIHVPIILTVTLPLLFGWRFPLLFTPIHVIFLELIMGPTCSIVYENEPIGRDVLRQKPRPPAAPFLSLAELGYSVLQGLVITLGTLSIEVWGIESGFSEAHTRTLVFSTLVLSNIFLTLENRSFYHSVFTTLRYRNRLVPLIIGLSLLILGLALFVPPVMGLFGFTGLPAAQLLLVTGVAFLTVFWFELLKWVRRLSRPSRPEIAAADQPGPP